ALMVRELVLLRGYGGDPHRKAVVAAELARLAPDFGADPWFSGVYSLALSEVGEVAAATRLAMDGLAARPDHGVLAHSLAHTYFEQRDDTSAGDFLDAWLT